MKTKTSKTSRKTKTMTTIHFPKNEIQKVELPVVDLAQPAPLNSAALLPEVGL